MLSIKRREKNCSKLVSKFSAITTIIDRNFKAKRTLPISSPQTFMIWVKCLIFRELWFIYVYSFCQVLNNDVFKICMKIDYFALENNVWVVVYKLQTICLKLLKANIGMIDILVQMHFSLFLLTGKTANKNNLLE